MLGGLMAGRLLAYYLLNRNTIDEKTELCSNRNWIDKKNVA